MKYMMLLYQDPDLAPNYSPAEMQAAVQAWQAVEKDAKAAGVWVDFHGLVPAAEATTVRVRGGKTQITDGPFAETHEVLAGAYVFNCKDLDEALAWAARFPGATYGSIEVRPLNQWSQG